MRSRRTPVLFFFLLSLVLCEQSQGQGMRTRTCVAFAPAGTLATGTVKTDEVEIKLNVSGALVVTTHASIPNSRSCEETFSNDGKWLATLVSGSQLTVVIQESNNGKIHKQFSSEWRQVADRPIEWSYESSFLGGFLPDDSLIVWRYVTRVVAHPVDASHVDLHLQRWSVEGEMLSELDLGDLGFGVGGRHPIFANGLGLLLVPGRCASACYKEIEISEAQEVGFLNLPADLSTGPAFLPDNNGLLTILGQRSIQKLALLDPTGRLQKQVTLPHFPNLLRPVVPDWFYVDGKEISRDGEIAAVARTRVAWVLVDTDRDWGSEIVLLKMHPLAVTTVLKTGKGGIGTIAVDHRNGMVRLVGFWKERWHDMKYDEQHPGKWTEANN
jgi:hypothetical protein